MGMPVERSGPSVPAGRGRAADLNALLLQHLDLARLQYAARPTR